MINYIFLTIASLIAIFLPVAVLVGGISLAHANKARRVGFLHYLPWALVSVMAIDVLFSGRSLNNEYLTLHNDFSRSAIPTYAIRICTILIIAASLERVFNFLMINKNPFGQNAYLTIFFALFWLGSVGLTSVFSTHAYFSHEYVYCLIIGLGVLTLSKSESFLFLITLRNSILFFVVASLICTFVMPELVVQTNYSQGFIAGLPRFAGLAPHAVVFGVFSLILLVLTIKFPFKSSRLQMLVLLLTLIGLLMAQSKTVWVTMLQVFTVLIFYGVKGRVQGEPFLKSQIVLSVIVSLVFLLNIALVVSLLGGFVNKVSLFLNSKDGSQLLTLTGRDVIWEYSLSEWRNNPLFGYGSRFLDFDHRSAIGLANATHAHNQFVDLLARSGSVGFLSVIPYLGTIICLIFMSHKKDRDIAIIIFLIVINRSVSEVPLSLYGYSHEFLIQMAMIVALLFSLKDKSIPTKNEVLNHNSTV